MLHKRLQTLLKIRAPLSGCMGAAFVFGITYCYGELEIDATGSPQFGITPHVVACWTSNTWDLVLEFIQDSNVSRTVAWLAPSTTFSAAVELIRTEGKEVVTNHLYKLPVIKLENQTSVSELLAQFPRRRRGYLWLEIRGSRSNPMRLNLPDSAFARAGATDRLIIRPLLYKVLDLNAPAQLVKFAPLEISLPPLAPLSAAKPPSPSLSPLPVDPNWANPDRVAALANLPLPTARWIPWVVCGIALASLLAVGTLLHRRRKRGTPPP